jgi:hypothetical protein
VDYYGSPGIALRGGHGDALATIYGKVFSLTANYRQYVMGWLKLHGNPSPI